MAYLRTIGRTNKQRKPTGTVKWFNAVKGFGFICPDDGTKDVFVHLSAVQRSGMTTLEEGQRVEYEMVAGKDGRTSAHKLKLKQEHLLTSQLEGIPEPARDQLDAPVRPSKKDPAFA